MTGFVTEEWCAVAEHERTVGLIAVCGPDNWRCSSGGRFDPTDPDPDHNEFRLRGSNLTTLPPALPMIGDSTEPITKQEYELLDVWYCSKCLKKVKRTQSQANKAKRKAPQKAPHQKAAKKQCAALPPKQHKGPAIAIPPPEGQPGAAASVSSMSGRQERMRLPQKTATDPPHAADAVNAPPGGGRTQAISAASKKMSCRKCRSSVGKCRRPGDHGHLSVEQWHAASVDQFEQAVEEPIDQVAPEPLLQQPAAPQQMAEDFYEAEPPSKLEKMKKVITKVQEHNASYLFNFPIQEYYLENPNAAFLRRCCMSCHCVGSLVVPGISSLCRARWI